MDFMDLDDDLESNPIRDFLKNKLDVIKYENTKLQETLEELKEEIENASNAIEDVSDSILVQKSWIKIIHDKYAIWFLVENNTKVCLEDCQLILRWDSSSSLVYKTSMFLIPESLAVFNQAFRCIEKKSYIVSVIDRPDFLEKLSIEISGMLLCTLKGKEVSINIPEVSIMSKDITDKNKIVPLYKLIESNIPDFVSCLACSYKINLIQKSTHHPHDIFSTLEIDASLYKCNFDEDKEKSFFVAHKISPVFDGCIIELAKPETLDIRKTVIYYRCQESLIACIHHLFQTITSLILLPEEYEHHLHSKSVDECEELLKRCILKEIDFAKKITSKASLNINNLKEIRFQLCDIEHKTDEAYIQLRVAKDRAEKENLEYRK